MLRFFSRKRLAKGPSPGVDIHSHLLPGIDDGVKTLDESIDTLKEFIRLGFRKVITTPHIMNDFYKNTPEIIMDKLKIVRKAIEHEGLEIEIDAAAEYYLDEFMMKKVEDGEELLTFGKNYVLVETSFINEPIYLKEAFFNLKARGYQPVLAHPERYLYLNNNWELVTDLLNRGILFQLNVNSLSGIYNRPVIEMAEKMIRNSMVHFVGSDCHHLEHLKVFEEMMSTRTYHRLMELDLLNRSL